MRHKQLYQIITNNKPTTIVEVGTHNGRNAINMVAAALKAGSEHVHYYGFDLFEDITPEISESELNVKSMNSLDAVREFLNTYAVSDSRFTFDLYKGNTNETLAMDGPWHTADIAFIDGGHSVHTIANDYEHLKACKIVVFDDFYVADKNGKVIDTEKYGCNKLVSTLNHAVMPTFNPVELGGGVGMVVSPAGFSPYPSNVQVRTQNCVDKDQICANISYSTRVAKNWAPACVQHRLIALVISAGDDYKNHLDALRELSTNPEYRVFCVKTNHNDLIAEGIVPFGCILLDPRPKVRRFITPHKDVKYFAASMVHPSTIDLLKPFQLYLYNAVVNAGEAEIIRAIPNQPRAMRLVGGGSTAAARAIPLIKQLGFRRFVLYGYDSCYAEPKDETELTKNGQKKFWRVEKHGKTFWTSLELLAQAQDFEKYGEMINNDQSLEIECVGDGMIPHIWRNMMLPLEKFDEIYPV